MNIIIVGKWNAPVYGRLFSAYTRYTVHIRYVSCKQLCQIKLESV